MTATNKECFEAVIEEMRKVLKQHDAIKGNSWRFKSEHELIDDLMQAVSYTHLDVYKRQMW